MGFVSLRQPSAASWSVLQRGARMEPTQEEITQGSLDKSAFALLEWAGCVRGPVWDSLANLLGFGADDFHPRVIAKIPDDTINTAINSWQVEASPASIVAKAQAANFCYAAKAVCGALPQPLPAPAAQPDLTALVTSMIQATVGQAKQSKVVRASLVLDPTDESIVPAATTAQMDQWLVNYKTLKGGVPQPEAEPTPEQVAALEARVVTLDLEPYADFSLLTPFGRRMAKALKYRSWNLQQDGSYVPYEAPGPSDFSSWHACWRVYANALLMLTYPPAVQGDPPVPVVTVQALEDYLVAFQTLVSENSEAWHLCIRAEDRCRAELFPRLRRSWTAGVATSRGWSDVFEAAAKDDRFWDREVRRPALAFIARGVRALPAGATFAEGLIGHATAKRDKDDLTRPTASAKKRARLERKRERDPQIAAAGVQEPSRGGAGADKGHPKRDHRGRYVTTADGQPICFKVNSKDGACESPCPAGRHHVCQMCLGSHAIGDPACKKAKP